jgi:prevent-host-death family protein
MKVSPTKLKKSLDDILAHIAETGERVIVVSRGKVKAALISAEELGQLQDLDEAVATWEEEGSETIDLEALEAELGLSEEKAAPAPKKKARKRSRS